MQASSFFISPGSECEKREKNTFLIVRRKENGIPNSKKMAFLLFLKKKSYLCHIYKTKQPMAINSVYNLVVLVLCQCE